MDSPPSGPLHYSSLIWLSQSSNLDTAAKLVLATTESKLDNQLWVCTHKASLIDYRSVKDVHAYFQELQLLLKDKQKILAVIDYTSAHEVTKHRYIAKLTKFLVSADTVYIKCPHPLEINKQNHKAFDYVVSDVNVVESLLSILTSARTGVYL